MKVVCAWCERDGKPGYLGDRQSPENSATTHGICPSHAQQVLEDFTARSYPSRHLVRRFLRAALSALVILCGCARPPEKVWIRFGSAQEVSAQDVSPCMHEARTQYANAKVDPHTGVSSSSGVLVDAAVFDNCKEAKGWRLVDK